jgi:hypothetical protein
LAGLGRKVFNSGDILLASEVQGYLQDQSVMVFEDAAARGSAIPSPTEGMVTFRKDDNALEVYDGAAFNPVGTEPGLVHINTTSFSAVASQSINDVFSADYDNYRILIRATASANVNINIRYRVSGSDDTTSNYGAAVLNLRTGSTTPTGGRTANLGHIGFFGSSTRSGNISSDIFSPFASVETSYNSISTGDDTSFTWLTVVAGNFALTTSFTGFTIFPTSGNITGSVSVYGI